MRDKNKAVICSGSRKASENLDWNLGRILDALDKLHLTDQACYLQESDEMMRLVELYDLDDDPYEMNNLAVAEGLDDLRDNLARRLDEWTRQTSEFVSDANRELRPKLSKSPRLRKSNIIKYFKKVN